MRPALTVVEAGPLTTVQDLGRRGWQRFGISASGAMDGPALQLANALVGNAPGEAGVEVGLTGGSFACEAESCRVALAGGFALQIDGEAADPYCGHLLRRGSRLVIGRAAAGMWGYLAVAGGFEIAPTLGSCSTHTRSGLGGVDGGPLRAGARLPLRRPAVAEDEPARLLPPALRPAYEGPVRVVFGPQEDRFTAAGKQTLLTAEYRVSAQSDRMGYRLDGPAIAHAGGFNIISDGIANGSIQVPGSGRPIVLLADRQSTGGYPKIATVIQADLPRLAQRRPGEVVRFEAVSVEAAEELAIASAAAIAGASRGFLAAVAAGTELSAERLLAVNLISGVVADEAG